MRIALYQPDIPQNTGTILRLAACMGVAVDVIGPAGFDLSAKAMQRAGMDYLAHASLTQHASWTAYLEVDRPGRIVLLTTRTDVPHHTFRFLPSDTLLLGRESAGVPTEVHDLADARLRIPMAPGLRSLNVAVATAIVLGEAMRQTDGWPE